MVPSSVSIAKANIMLNTIVAEKLSIYADLLEGAENFNEEVAKLLQNEIKQHKGIIFNGDGYSDDWIVEAERRGLPNIKTTVDAISNYNRPEYIEMFEKHKVFRKSEIISRQEILFEEYEKVVNIEALTMIQMAKKEIIPAVIEYTTILANAINSVKLACKTADTSTQEELLERVTKLLAEVSKKLVELEKAQQEAKEEDTFEKKAFAFRNNVTKAMSELRKPCDCLETIVAEKYWPMPTYVDLLYRV
jgi:glutamine synthetase